MKNAWAKLRERYSDHIDVAVELSSAISEDDVDAIKKIVFKYFSMQDTAPLLNGNIALFIEGDDVLQYPPAILALLRGKRNALRAILEITGNPNVRENPDDPEHSPTLLIKAVNCSDIEMVKLILEAGANLNEEYRLVSDDGQVKSALDALALAVICNFNKTAHLLMDAGAVPSLRAAFSAGVNNDDYSQVLERIIALCPELLNKRFTVDGAETSLLNLAIGSGKLSFVRWLIEQGAAFSTDAGGGHPLDVAIHGGHDDIAQFLQSMGAVSGKRDEAPALQNPSATKQEISKIIERLELLEEKFGIAISGLYATCELNTWRIPHYHEIKINFDVASSMGIELDRSFSICASAYNSTGQLLGAESTKIYKDDFLGFASMSITFHVDQSPEKIRLFLAV